MATLNDLVAENSGGLKDRIASSSGKVDAAGADLLAQLTSLQDQQTQLGEQAADQPKGLEHLLSVPGIMSLLTAAGGAVTGNNELLAGGVGGALGAVEGGNAQSAANSESLLKTRAMMGEALDKKRQALASMIQSSPELFIDSQTGESAIDGRLLAFASTGFVLPIDVAVNYKLKQQTERTKALIDTGLSAALQGDTEEARTVGVKMLSAGLKIDFTLDEVDALAGMDPTDQFLSLASKPGILTSSVLAAWKHHTENPELDLGSSEIVGMLTADESRDSQGGKFTIADKQLQLIGQLNRLIAKTPEAFVGLTWPEKIDLALGEAQQADALLLKQYFEVDDPFGAGVSATQMFNAIANNTEILANIYSIRPDSKLFADMGITSSDDIWTKGVTSVRGSVPVMKQLNLDAADQSRGLAQSRVTAEIKKNVEGVTDSGAANAAAKVIRQLVTDNTSSTGVLDGRAFQEAVNKWIKEGSKE